MPIDKLKHLRKYKQHTSDTQSSSKLRLEALQAHQMPQHKRNPRRLYKIAHQQRRNGNSQQEKMVDANNGVWILEDRARARTLYRRESTRRRVGVLGPIGRQPTDQI